MIKVERKRVYKNRISSETHFFISSLSPKIDPKVFFDGIRNHWGIESYHYVKDVSFKEDSSRIRKKNAPENMSLLRSVIINIFRSKGVKSIPKYIRKIAHNMSSLRRLILE